MPPVATVGDSNTLSLSEAGVESGMGEGNIHQLEDLILDRFLSRDARARSCLGRIGKGARCCVKPRLISGEGLKMKHCRVKTYVSRKWYPPPPEEAFLFQKGGIVFS